MSGKGKGKGGGGYGAGGYCICSKCGERVPHQRGVSCIDTSCPVCGKRMIREKLYEEKRKDK